MQAVVGEVAGGVVGERLFGDSVVKERRVSILPSSLCLGIATSFALRLPVGPGVNQ